MVVARGRRRVRHPHVARGAELQKALRPGRAVLRALALVAVRQQQHEPAGLPPLGLAGGQELVDDDLRAVDEVAELGLPHRQPVRRREAVAVLEP